MSTFRRVHLIYNPNAGRLIANPGLVDRVAAILRPEVCATRGPGHATELARASVERGAEAIAAMGGDGTLNEVLNGMVGSGVPLATIPAGTANVLACELGIPRHAERAARELGTWTPARIAVGRLHAADAPPRHFLLMAGAGLDAAVIQLVRPETKRKLGKVAYWIAGLSMMGRRLPQIEVEAEGRRFVTGFALTSRVRNYGGDLNIAARASLFSDQFELLTFRGETTWPYTAYLGGAVFGKAASVPGVESIHTRRLELRVANGAAAFAQVDGELAGALPATVEIVPDAVTLLVPRGHRQVSGGG